MTRSKWVLATLLALSLSLPISAQQKESKAKGKKEKEDVEAIGDRDVGGGINFYSIDKEIALGKQLAEEVERNTKIVADPLIAEYVNRVGQNLVRNSDAKVPFTIKVIDSDQVNAFALPGGYLFVNTGLIEKTETEGELAGVLAHEIAHVAARHGTRQASRGQLINLASIPLIFMGGWTGYAIRQGAGLAIPITFLEFSRGFEREADFLGLQYLYKTGYDPNAFVEFFEKLQAMEKRKPGTLAKVFRSHPLSEDRIVDAQKEINTILPAKPEYVISTSEFSVMKDRLAALNRSAKEKPQPGKPRLKRTGPQPSGPVEDTQDEAPGEEDERPTLKRQESKLI